MPIAALSDIHGNLAALEAVLDHARARGADVLLDLGDILYGPLWPRATYDRLRREPFAATIRGNQDREIFAASAADLAASPTLAEVTRDLGPGPIDWLRQLPATAELGDEVLLCHGTPSDDAVYLLEDVSGGRPALRSDAAITALLGGANHPVILCGHSHTPRLVALASGQLVVNPGSVGLPAYADGHPVDHAVESRSPHAAYAILERGGHGWSVELCRVAYDGAAAAARARLGGRDDWARALATGRV